MKIKMYRTARDTDERFKEVNSVQFIEGLMPRTNVISVDSSREYQEFMGFGGAFTEAASITIGEAPLEIRNKAIKLYFDEKYGLRYKLGRVSIHSCDFGLGNYTYIEDGDSELKSFDMSRDDEYIVPLIKAAEEAAGVSLKILASPWSPPAFMKDTNEMNYGGKLLRKYYQSWANYFVKYNNSMKDRGINLWGFTVQNEPAATQTWDSCQYTPEDERDFIKDYLGPTFEREGLSDKAILFWDHNRDVIVERAIPVLSDPKASKYIWGIGNHWYVSEDFENLGKIHDLFPDKHIIFTEGCVEYGIYGSEKSWKNGEKYGRNIIGDFNNWSRGWIDWNLFLNEQGGPNHANNFCESPIMYDREKNELIINTSYYYIGHFSKYIDVGAKRINTTVHYNGDCRVYATSFKNPNGEIIVIAQNEGWIGELSLIVDGKCANISLPNNSISTFVIK